MKPRNSAGDPTGGISVIPRPSRVGAVAAEVGELKVLTRRRVMRDLLGTSPVCELFVAEARGRLGRPLMFENCFRPRRFVLPVGTLAAGGAQRAGAGEMRLAHVRAREFADEVCFGPLAADAGRYVDEVSHRKLPTRLRKATMAKAGAWGWLTMASNGQ
jgi:hypothetical protein